MTKSKTGVGMAMSNSFPLTQVFCLSYNIQMGACAYINERVHFVSFVHGQYNHISTADNIILCTNNNIKYTTT